MLLTNKNNTAKSFLKTILIGAVVFGVFSFSSLFLVTSPDTPTAHAQAGEEYNQRPGQKDNKKDNKKDGQKGGGKKSEEHKLERETKGGSETCGNKNGPFGDGNDGVPIALGVGCKGSGNPIFSYLQGLIPILTAGVGIVVVGAIIYGGIVYASARGDKNQTMEGVKIITNAVIALVMFILMAAILEFLVPGGVV